MVAVCRVLYPPMIVILSILFMRFEIFKLWHFNCCGRLSILFMRFVSIVSLPHILHFPFNSLYEIRMFFAIWLCTFTNYLSILFMRFPKYPSIIEPCVITFNSLYEILIHYLKGLYLKLKPSFNSLYEIQMLLKECMSKLMQLSILFMRFWYEYWEVPESTLKRILSILFMRFEKK